MMKFQFSFLVVLMIFTSLTNSKSHIDELHGAKTTKGSGIYSIRKYTWSSGGGVSSGVVYSITNVMGQIEAGHTAYTPIHELRGGFLIQQSTVLGGPIFKDGFE